TDYSSAVTKGGHSILVKALLDSGNKRWFTVAERGGLKNLLQERQIIKLMRSEYRAPDGKKLPNLPPLIYGGIMIEGGIVSYDSNIATGGAGAIYLGVSGSTQYRKDLVTVYLRAINVQNGEVLLSVTSSKTIYSTVFDANFLKYITFDKLFQAEAGFSLNEPVQLGVRQAIETAVYSMIMEGAIDKIWSFQNPVAGNKAIKKYLKRRDGKWRDVDGKVITKWVLTDPPKRGRKTKPVKKPSMKPIKSSIKMTFPTQNYDMLNH
ncbi:MAG: CsgG/HfaB family protein, partial [Alphaproteobacteria bacterium]|nr:CsgG/HfaB family protein [Alphaproteobacteria bacterium]